MFREAYLQESGGGGGLNVYIYSLTLLISHYLYDGKEHKKSYTLMHDKMREFKMHKSQIYHSNKVQMYEYQNV